MDKIRTAILLALSATAIASLVVAMLAGNQEWDGLLLNLGTEIAGAVLTYGLFELFIGSRERQEKEKARLIAHLGSGVNDVAVAAAEELQRHGWLRDGSLHGVNLFKANLRGADLHAANLCGATLVDADLSEATLYWARLRNALLWSANLGGAKLHEADLRGADLSGANLKDAEVTEGQLARAESLKGIILPDGTKHD